VTSLLENADDLLRLGTADVGRGRRSPGGPALLALVVVCGLAYGAVMGAFTGSMGGPPRALQMLYSAVKVPLLLLATFALSLPSFFVLNSLMGLREDLAASARALLATQAGVTVVLAALAPFTLLWYASFDDYQSAILFNTLMFGVASITGQILLRRLYRPLIARDAKHRILLRIWLIIYAFVGIQMGWLLRPFIGDPKLPTRFLREDTWGNAYVILVEKVFEVLGR
jgi:hypothetical protein